MWTDEFRKDNKEIEAAALRAGGYVDYTPERPLIMDYDYHAMSDYARAKGITTTELTEDELKKFEFSVPLVYT